MIEWKSFPFVRFLIPFAAGILLCLLLNVHIPVIALVVVFVISFSFHFFYRNKAIRLYRNASFIGLTFQLALLLAGNEIAYLHIDEHYANHYTHFLTEGTIATVRILEPPIEKEKSWKANAEILSIGNAQQQHPTCGDAILYFQKDGGTLPLNYGDILQVKNNFQEIPSPKNPDEFNYKKFLFYNNIYASAYLKNDDWKQLPIHQINPVYELTYWLRDKSIEAFKRYIPDKEDAAVTEALVVGYRDNMSFDIMQSWASAGVVHVLAVSGLHVALLFSLLNAIFFFLDKRKHGKRIKSFIIISLIWMFALLTGMSGSVIRSAMMFTFITIGKNVNRTISMPNILGCSAFTILLFQPMLVMDVGFQLSYVAVLGISELFPYINKWLHRTNKVVDFIWSTIAVSIAAQVATLPFTVYYFNLFPTFFLLANLVVIPLSAFILYAGIALAVLQFIQPLAYLLGQFTYGLVHFLNSYIMHIHEIPFSSIHLSSFSFYESLLLALVIIFMIRFFLIKEKYSLVGSVASLVLLLISQSLHLFEIHQGKSITLYHFPGKSCLEFNEGGKAVVLRSDDSLTEQENYYLQHHWQLSRTKLAVMTSIDSAVATTPLLNGALWKGRGFYQFHNYKLAIINKPLPPNSSADKIKLDAIVLAENPNIHINNLMSWFDAPLIIFDGSNSTFELNRWEQETKQLNIPVYEMTKQGAFNISL